ncbi:MAG: DUF6231 family protein [Woeseia sp.]
MTPQQLPSLLDVFADPATDGSYLVVSRTDPPLPLEKLFPDNSSVEWLCHVYTADDTVAVSLADLGIVFDQLEHMEKEEGVRLLSRLRDHHCRRVLLHCMDEFHSKSALLALGFIEQQCPSDGGRLYLFDPDL